MPSTSRREQALAPLSRTDAERLLPTLSARRLAVEERLLHGRCLRILESFQPAWSELDAFRAKERDPLLRARADIDLLYLAYYLVRPDVADALAAEAEPALAGRPLLAAELSLARSLVATGADRISDAFTYARFADDALRVAPAGRERDVVAASLRRQLAHLHAHAAGYADATAAAEQAERAAERTHDRWEMLWSAYARGFVDWSAGRLEDARAALERAEQGLRESRSGLWRWTTFCLGTVEAELGVTSRALRLVQESAFGTPDALAYIALRRGEAAVAEEMLDKAPPSPSATAILGLARCQRGDERVGIRLLDEARAHFESIGLLHQALGCGVHAGYWRERAHQGGEASALRAFVEIAANGGEGFAWYDAPTALWLGRLARRDARTRDAAARMLERAERILGVSETAAATATPSVESAVPFLRARGLTAREIEVLRAVEALAGQAHDRDLLAKRLDMSPNTLRVHLTRIRSKLDVGPRRGDDALLQAALRPARS